MDNGFDMPRSDYLTMTMPLADFLRDPRMRTRIADMSGFREETRIFLAMRGIEYFGHLMLHRDADLGRTDPAVLHDLKSAAGRYKLKLGLTVDPNQFPISLLAQMLAQCARMPVTEVRATPHVYARHGGHKVSGHHASRPIHTYHGRSAPKGHDRT